jgi:hypothetical protein
MKNMKESSRSEGSISVVVTDTHQGSQMKSGWDIKFISIDGRIPQTEKVGDYPTEQAAFEAAFAKAKELKK